MNPVTKFIDIFSSCPHVTNQGGGFYPLLFLFLMPVKYCGSQILKAMGKVTLLHEQPLWGLFLWSPVAEIVQPDNRNDAKCHKESYFIIELCFIEHDIQYNRTGNCNA